MSVTQATLLGDTFGSQASGTIPVGGIIMWSGSTASIPTGWALCNGTNGTPNLLDRFIVGAGSGYGVGATGGASSVTLSINEMPSHNHGGSAGVGGRHGHKIRISSYDGSFGNTNAGRARGGFITVNGNDTNIAGRIDDPTAAQYQQLGGADGGDVNASGQHSHSITAEGGNAAHENRPPYYALAFIMRVS